jgi:hypothetical protein
VAPIEEWTPYTSEVYGFQMKYPPDWIVHGSATREWEAGDGQAPADDWPWADTFENSDSVDGDSIGLWVYEVPAGDGADIESVEGLTAWALAFCTSTSALRDLPLACEESTQQAVPMCLVAGGDTCRAAILVPGPSEPYAYFMDWESVMMTSVPDRVTVLSIGRPDDFPAAARYGGSVELLRSFLTTFDVWTPGDQPVQ